MILITEISEAIVFFVLKIHYVFVPGIKEELGPRNWIILLKDSYVRFTDQEFHLSLYKLNEQKGECLKIFFNHKNLSLDMNISFSSIFIFQQLYISFVNLNYTLKIGNDILFLKQ